MNCQTDWQFPDFQSEETLTPIQHLVQNLSASIKNKIKKSVCNNPEILEEHVVVVGSCHNLLL